MQITYQDSDHIWTPAVKNKEKATGVPYGNICMKLLNDDIPNQSL